MLLRPALLPCCGDSEAPSQRVCKVGKEQTNQRHPSLQETSVSRSGNFVHLTSSFLPRRISSTTVSTCISKYQAPPISEPIHSHHHISFSY